ncbi:phytoene/squalene synthase family protein [Brucella haematophila]|uniref:Phytoene/squalene synthase family protein n=1 Tax=Brucella haematophila TaxID=419474 RepID=A0ABX1DMR3_9HYPH|nr:phytoene/squalene synthase family protein [Brucella haematophila]NKC02902.1 phytoene/squalene synthase family protein [Brucella haematophila]TMV03439.1 phytoene/squalene synthase family protein [Brucella haematophila]
MNQNEAHCLALLREADRDRYLSVLYAPEDKRGGLAALYAFNAEVARIRDLVHEPLPGEVRLQWWRDLINGEARGSAEAHPVAAALVETINKYELPRTAFDNYCEARIFDLYDDPMPSRNDLEGYCGETASAIIQLAGFILDRDAAQAHSETAGHAGVAQAVTGLLRLLPTHRRRGQLYVPADMLASVGVTREAFLGSDDPSACERVVSVMLALAREHLAIFDKANAALPKSLAPAFLPMAIVPAYLKAIERLGGKAAERTADISAIRKQWLMFRANF